MRILQIAASLKIGGAEKVARDLGICAIKSGHEVHYVVFGDEIGDYEAELTAVGARIYHVASPSQGYRQYIDTLKLLMRDNRYDAVHAHTMFNIGWVMWAAKQCHVPIRIAHAHSALDTAGGLKTRLYEKAMRHLILQNATDLIACGKAAGIRLFGTRAYRERGTLILNGIDTAAFAYSVDRRIQIRKGLKAEEAFLIGHVGHLAEVKNQGFLIRLMPELLKRKPNAKLLLLGEGPDRPMLEEMIRELHLTEKVIMTGNVRNVSDYLSAMDVFEFPSLYEGMPLSIIEVQANGLPCILSTEVPKDVYLTDLVNALPLDQPRKWVEAICAAKRSESEKYAEELKTKGFDTASVMEKFLHIYERAEKMIKILFFIETLAGGGAEKVLCNLVNALDQSRFDVTVQTLWKADAERYLKPGIRYRYCYESQSRGNSYRSRLEAAAGLTYPLHIKDDYDIEVAYLECGATKIMASSTNRRAKKVAWVHCDLALKMSNPEEFAEKAAPWYAKFDQVVCVSQNVKDSFDRMFGIAEKTSVLYNTIDDAEIRRKAELRPENMPEKQRLTAVTLGRLTHQKAYDRLLRCHKQLIQESISYDLWILGEGEDRAALEQFIADNGLSDSVHLFGFCKNPYPYIKAADLLVCSSRYEGFSTFVTEGMILGKPVVTTDCTGMRELLGDSEYGLIVENKEESLLRGMRRMLSEPELRQSYANKAAIRGRNFSARQLTEKTEQFFLKLLEE